MPNNQSTRLLRRNDQPYLPPDPGSYPMVINVPLDLAEIIPTRGRKTTDTAEEYAGLLRERVTLPPGEAIYDGERLWLWDGAIRRLAYQMVARDLMPLRIAWGSESDAYRLAYRANAQHGLRRSPADKRQSVELALQREGGAKVSSRELARLCMVSHTFAVKVRGEYLATLPDAAPNSVQVTRNRQTYQMNTSGIGRSETPTAEPPEQQDRPARDASAVSPPVSTTTRSYRSTSQPTQAPEFDHDWQRNAKVLLRTASPSALSWLRNRCDEQLRATIPAEVVAWRGPSEVNGETIRVVVGSLGTTSRNAKTGDVVQVAILNDSLPPWEAAKTGKDTANCGNCKHRLNALATCYVYGDEMVLYQGAWKRTLEEPADLDNALALIRQANKPVRVGAYGDPAAVPYEVISKIVDASGGPDGLARYTMYTHRWVEGDQRYREIALASVDTEDEYEAAHRVGWETFRVAPSGGCALPEETHCLHALAAERGVTVHCSDCLGCRPARGSRFIHIHSTPRKCNTFNTFMLADCRNEQAG